MKHFLKGTTVTAGIIIINMLINVVCNMNGVDLNSTTTGTMSAVCGIFIYDRLIQHERTKEAPEQTEKTTKK